MAAIRGICGGLLPDLCDREREQGMLQENRNEPFDGVTCGRPGRIAELKFCADSR